jgi:hypothetical protein
MRDAIEEEETNKIIEYACNNTEETIGGICKKFKITPSLAFYIVSEAGKKKLGKL